MKMSRELLYLNDEGPITLKKACLRYCEKWASSCVVDMWAAHEKISIRHNQLKVKIVKDVDW